MNLQGQKVPIPAHDYAGIAWVSPNWIVVSRLPNVTEEDRLWKVRPNGFGLSRLPLGHARGCHLTSYMFPSTLPDSRLGFLKWCIRGTGGVTSDWTELRALNLATGDAERLARDGPHRYLNELDLYPPITYTWNPEMDRALIGSGSGICNTLYWVRRGGGLFERPISVPGPEETFTVNSRLFGSDDDCDLQPRAGVPAWSPDGSRIAFVASPDSAGVRGFARLDVPWNLYFMSPEDLEAVPKTKGLLEPRSLLWSPDGSHLAFTARRPGTARRFDVWVYSDNQDRFIRLGTHSLQDLAWSPDGRRLAGLRDVAEKPTEFRSEIWVYDLSPIVDNHDLPGPSA